MQLKAQDQTKPSRNYREITHITKTKNVKMPISVFRVNFLRLSLSDL